MSCKNIFSYFLSIRYDENYHSKLELNKMLQYNNITLKINNCSSSKYKIFQHNMIKWCFHNEYN